MFNIFDKNKPFKDNDINLKVFYWLGTIFLFLLLGAGLLGGISEFFFGAWWKGLAYIGGTIFAFFVLYYGFMVLIGFLVDVKIIRNRLYKLANDDFYEEERITNKNEDLYHSPRR